MLAKRGLKTLRHISDYHDVFCFPVKQYYQNLGFDFTTDSFEDLAEEYISLYYSGKSGGCGLHNNAKHVLDFICQQGIIQSILSASEISNLLTQIGEFDIKGYFDEILGLSDIYAKSKIDVGLDYISRKNITHALMIGDTVHDYDVAKKLGIDIVLIPNGHQNKKTLLSCNVPVLDDISCVIELFGHSKKINHPNCPTTLEDDFPATSSSIA